MQKKVSLKKRIFQITGYALTLASLAYIATQLAEHISKLAEALTNLQTVKALVLGSLLYAGLYALIAVGWHILLNTLQKGALPFRHSFFIYSRTSIAKYLPGNFGHLAGRHFMAGRFSIKHTVIGAASMLEILCQVSAALLICLWAKLPIAPRISPELGLLLSVCVLVLLPMAFIRFGGNAVTAFREIRLKSLYVAIGLACIIDIAFFLCNGSLIYYIAMAAGLPMTTGLPTFISVYAVAWFLGLVTPGAPAGIGIREAVIVGMLGSVMPESASLVLALLFRLATSIGELLFFASSFMPFFDKNSQHQPSKSK